MAITKCPECGGTVSTSVNACIHCGCKFVVCPECGAASKAGSDACPECGFAFAGEEKVVAPVAEPKKVEVNEPEAAPVEEPKEAPVEEPKEKTKEEIKEEKKKEKAQLLRCVNLQQHWKDTTKPEFAKACSRLATLFSIFLFVAAIILAIGFASINFTFLQGIVKPSILFGVSAIVFAFGIPFGGSDLFGAIEEFINVKSFWDYAKYHNYDLAQIHKEQVASLRAKGDVTAQAVKYSELRENNKFTIDTLFYNCGIGKRSSILILGLVKFAVYIPITYLAVTFIISNMGFTSMPQSMSEVHGKGLFIGAVVIYAITTLVMFIIKKVIERKKELFIDGIEKS